MKKILYILALILEIASFVGAWTIHYFSVRKMGMIRYVNHKNMSWERDYPVEILTTVCAAAAVVLTVLILLAFLKRRRELTGLTAAMNAAMVVLTALYAGYALGCSKEVMADYYFISGLFLLAASVQIVKTGLSTFALGRRKEKGSEE